MRLFILLSCGLLFVLCIPCSDSSDMSNRRPLQPSVGTISTWHAFRVTASCVTPGGVTASCVTPGGVTASCVTPGGVTANSVTPGDVICSHAIAGYNGVCSPLYALCLVSILEQSDCIDHRRPLVNGHLLMWRDVHTANLKYAHNVVLRAC